MATSVFVLVESDEQPECCNHAAYPTGDMIMRRRGPYRADANQGESDDGEHSGFYLIFIWQR